MTKDEALKLALEAMTYADACLKKQLTTKDKHEYAQDLLLEAGAAIKEALAQPEQEPVTWRYKIVDVFGRPAWTLKTPKSDTRVLESQPLYTNPPQRKPLTDEEIILIVAECASSHQHTDIHFARAIERAHGIKELV